MLHGRSIVGALAALVLTTATANAGTLPLSTLNAGPSSDSVPSSAGDRVATVVYPREIANPAMIPAFGDIYPTLIDATEVEAAGNTGLRWRSRALFPGNAGNNGRGEITVIALTDGFDATAAGSFVLFLSDSDAAVIPTLPGLATFIANNTAGADFVRYPLSSSALGFADGDLTATELADGVVITQHMLDVAIPIGGGAAGDYANFDLAIVVFSDGPFDGSNDAVATEWISVENDGKLVAPADAAFEFDNQTVRVRTNQQILDDFDAHNPADTAPANVSVTDFRVVFGTTLQTLADFLGGLNEPNTVASVNILADDSQMHDMLEITLSAPVTDAADIESIITSRIGFTGVDVDSITGNNQTTNSNTYQLMDRPEVACVGDIDGDGLIGLADLNAILSSFNTASTEPGYNAAADLDDDDFVGFTDLNIVLSAFNTACP